MQAMPRCRVYKSAHDSHVIVMSSSCQHQHKRWLSVRHAAAVAASSKSKKSSPSNFKSGSGHWHWIIFWRRADKRRRRSWCPWQQVSQRSPLEVLSRDIRIVCYCTGVKCSLDKSWEGVTTFPPTSARANNVRKPDHEMMHEDAMRTNNSSNSINMDSLSTRTTFQMKMTG